MNWRRLKLMSIIWKLQNEVPRYSCFKSPPLTLHFHVIKHLIRSWRSSIVAAHVFVLKAMFMMETVTVWFSAIKSTSTSPKTLLHNWAWGLQDVPCTSCNPEIRQISHLHYKLQKIGRSNFWVTWRHCNTYVKHSCNCCRAPVNT